MPNTNEECNKNINVSTVDGGVMSRYGADEAILIAAAAQPDLELGRVAAQSKTLYNVVWTGGESLAEISGKLRYGMEETAEYPVVGDFVLLDGLPSGRGLIREILPRRSAFGRAAAGGGQDSQVLAANIDVVFICMALDYDYNLNRLERYLAAAWSSGATPVVILTKADLCEERPRVELELSTVAAGVDVLFSSRFDEGACRQALAPYLGEGRTATFVGSSGVGKSTLINCLLGEEKLSTGSTRRDGKGRHTSTRRELLLLPGGGVVIDSPGIRELGLHTADLERSFEDIDRLAAGCRFRDCRHEGEPGCAVEAAVAEGALEARRLDSYRKLLKETAYDGLSPRQIEEQKISAMFGGKKEMKKFRDHYKKKN